MKAGALNKRATFQQPILNPDGSGGWNQTWGNDLSVWCNLTPEKAREKIQQGRIADAQSGTLTVRSSVETREIDGSWRVTVRDVTYNIRSHENQDQVNEMIEMIVEVDGTVATGATP